MAAQYASKWAFNIYMLATHMWGANSLTVEQLCFGEESDAQRAAMRLPVSIPLSKCCDQVAAAMKACGQSGSLSKMRIILSPMAPQVAKALVARPYDSRGGG